MSLFADDLVWVGATTEGDTFSVSEGQLRKVLQNAGRDLPPNGEAIVYGGVVFTRKRVDRPFRHEAS